MDPLAKCLLIAIHYSLLGSARQPVHREGIQTCLVKVTGDLCHGIATDYEYAGRQNERSHIRA
jgi:hypothetical protein